MRWSAVFAVLAALAGCGERVASAPFDGLPLDQATAAGAPLHVGVACDAGLRADRITQRVVFDVPSSTDEIVAAGEVRWVFH